MKTYIDEKLESISKGFLDGSFIFEVTSYSYIEGGYNSMGGDYTPTVNRGKMYSSSSPLISKSYYPPTQTEEKEKGSVDDLPF
jgi:hypothetical protein